MIISYIWFWFVFLVVSSSIEELDYQISQMMRKVPNEHNILVWECSSCGQTSSKGIDIKRHIEARHVSFPGFNCNNCGKLYKTRNSLRNHHCIVWLPKPIKVFIMSKFCLISPNFSDCELCWRVGCPDICHDEEVSNWDGNILGVSSLWSNLTIHHWHQAACGSQTFSFSGLLV